ncbi:glycosyltransferase family 2 protein [Puniceibacterium sediminis]|uniref:Glycosyl transferase family 2 n=1 Tax=Puniceibacterium sediminis TaxID=1608407 RepID=A0A238YMC0_9RHOB|nr:glycosyltransferase [Puniceibacterium sediminis]SNR72406.1 Glycosyl transferase family 2 [Puniceibacterium sediminis]
MTEEIPQEDPPDSQIATLAAQQRLLGAQVDALRAELARRDAAIAALSARLLEPDAPLPHRLRARLRRARFARALRHSGLFDAAWYLRHHPDGAQGGPDPLAHFLRLGHALGRAPGPQFSPRAYLLANPDVAAAGVDPLHHYLSRGRDEGRALDVQPAVQSRAGHLRGLLETGGLEESGSGGGPLRALTALAEACPPDPEARQALAVWALHQGQPAEAARWLRNLGPAMAPLHLISTAQAGDGAAARQIRATPPVSDDLDLAAAHLDPRPGARLACLNAALARAGLAPMTLRDGDGPLLDRLTPKTPPLPQGGDGPLVSVILAAHNAAAMLTTALDAVLGQSWQALELIVVDDASSDATAMIAAQRAAHDPRLTVIRLPQNQGAYGARNAGLAAARGTYVTLHDADDWSHPERIARQVQFLETQRGFVGCLTLQARVTADLAVSRWTGEGRILHENMTSLMLPRALLTDTLGGWDELRVSADGELLRRVRRLYGAGSVPELPGGPLALQRDHGGNATADAATGMGWFLYGARREYFEAQSAYHASAATLRYTGRAPFPAPAVLHPGFDAEAEMPLDHVYAGLLGLRNDAFESLLRWLDADRAAGRRVGLVPLYGMALPTGAGLSVHASLRARIDGVGLRVLCYGERIRCARLRFLPGQEDLAEPLRYLPQITVDGRLVMKPRKRTTD